MSQNLHLLFARSIFASSFAISFLFCADDDSSYNDVKNQKNGLKKQLINCRNQKIVNAN